MSRAFLYVLTVSGPEDLIKVGLTRDPLARWSSFHARWFEEFDIDHSQLVETETRKDAQRLETGLHSLLQVHACPMPLTLHAPAGGKTEWFRGAGTTASAFVRDLRSEGFMVHTTARPFIGTQMAVECERLYGLLALADNQFMDGTLTGTALSGLRNRWDAHCAFDPAIAERLPRDMLERLGLRN